VSFASLWVIPRLPAFRARHPDVEVYVSADDRLIDLGRGDVDIAVRYMADANAPDGGIRLFGERMLPVVAPGLVNTRDLPLSKPSDLARHVLLHLDDPDGRMPWLDWNMWLTSNGQPGLKPAGSLRFKLYDQVIQATVGGQGVALGRIPLIAEYLRDGRLVAPFPKRYESARGYYAVVAPHAGDRPTLRFCRLAARRSGAEAKRATAGEPPPKPGASRAIAAPRPRRPMTSEPSSLRTTRSRRRRGSSATPISFRRRPRARSRVRFRSPRAALRATRRARSRRRSRSRRVGDARRRRRNRDARIDSKLRLAVRRRTLRCDRRLRYLHRPHCRS
jgi:hypothetical protein